MSHSPPLLRTTGSVTLPRGVESLKRPSSPLADVFTTWVDHIPVIWVEPDVPNAERQLILWLGALGEAKEGTVPILRTFANHGLFALSFDAWQHGTRGTESARALLDRVFSNFRRHMWPILGQTTLDTVRVIDWARSFLDVNAHIWIGGRSMGGDVAIAAAGLDHRIDRVAAVVATPDWLRPGMQDIFHPGALLPPGAPDGYAQFFYDRLNPLTHVANYGHRPAMLFLCGGRDSHVPSDGALRFRRTLETVYPAAAKSVRVTIIPGLEHQDSRDRSRWWSECFTWLMERSVG